MSRTPRTPQDRALENEVILRRIFDLSGPWNLDFIKGNRLVSKAFKRASDADWKAYAAQLTIFQDEATKQLQEGNTVSGRTTTLSQFLKKKTKPLQRNLLLKNWKTYSTHYLSIDAGTSDFLVTNRRFWTVHGRNVTVLTMSGCLLPWSKEELFEKSFLQALPNLQRVSLCNCSLVSEFLFYKRSASENYDYFRPKRILPKPITSLRSIRVYNVTSYGGKVVLPWRNLLDKFTNLEEISVGHQPGNCGALAEALKRTKTAQNLKKLSIMDAFVGRSSFIPYYTPVPYLLQVNWEKLSLQRLEINCEYPLSELKLDEILKSQSGHLTELHLHRSIFSRPYANLLSTWGMPNVTELHVWGHVFENLNFLKGMPKLRVLIWNTICYDEDTHGDRFREPNYYQQHYPGMAARIVKATGGLPENFQHESLRTLEFQRGPVSLECWQKLGAWLPGLTRLKCLVVGEQHFALIGRLWPELERFEIGHGSILSARVILEAFLTDIMSFQSLESFVWKACPCLVETARVNNLWNEKDAVEVEIALQKRVVNEVILPWNSVESAGTPDADDDEAPVCLQNLYELAILLAGPHVLQYGIAVREIISNK